MSYDQFQSGVVVYYPYLWAREADRGETSGRKSRPVVVAIRVVRAGKPDLLALLPIATQPPASGRIASKIPDTEKRRAGLETSLEQWIMLDEYNAEILPGTYYLEPQKPLGRFGDAYLRPLLTDFLARITKVASVKRAD